VVAAGTAKQAKVPRIRFLGNSTPEREAQSHRVIPRG
jgi:hypothetical protein